jgi:hypothetical protein
VRRLLQDSFNRLWPVCHFVEKSTKRVVGMRDSIVPGGSTFSALTRECWGVHWEIGRTFYVHINYMKQNQKLSKVMKCECWIN